MTSSLSERLLARDRGALARLISWAEDGDPRFRGALAAVYGRVGRSWRVGITGPPGAGKSTLVSEMARLERAAEREVGILAVDPSSPFTGGALLGDRIRMEARTLDPGVFIRSMANRGSRGGIARATVDACDVMDAFGFDTLLIETVGVGQAEYDVVRAADTVAVVLCPGGGDGIQAMKAGLLEVADILVVNKSDLPGAEILVEDLEDAVRDRWTSSKGEWSVPVVSCSAGREEGVERIMAAVADHRAYLERTGLEEARRARRLDQIKDIVTERLYEEIWDARGWGRRLERDLDRMGPPYEVAEELLRSILEHVPGGNGTPAPAEGAEA